MQAAVPMGAGACTAAWHCGWGLRPAAQLPGSLKELLPVACASRAAPLQAALPPIQASVTITGNCNDAIFGGRCLIDAKAISQCTRRLPRLRRDAVQSLLTRLPVCLPSSLPACLPALRKGRPPSRQLCWFLRRGLMHLRFSTCVPSLPLTHQRRHHRHHLTCIPCPQAASSTPTTPASSPASS